MEERFAVTRVGTPARSISHRTAKNAEAWCLEHLSIPLTALGRLGRDMPFWIRLEYRVQESAATTDATADEGLTLAADRAPEPAAGPEPAGPIGGGRPLPLLSLLYTDFRAQPSCQLIVAFVVATILPMAATIWISTSLLERSLGYATTQELDRTSRALESTARQLYQREREALRESVRVGHPAAASYAETDRAGWPEDVRSFWESDEAERFVLSGTGGDHLDSMRRGPGGVDVYRRDLGRVRHAGTVGRRAPQPPAGDVALGRDLRRGFTLTLLLLVAAVWLVLLVPLLFLAHRVSQPIRQATAGLTGFAAGEWDRRLAPGRDDEVGWAVTAFNDMADQLRRGRERLVDPTQMSSWQTLARKTAHELKNSPTPIRLTVEEMLARQPATDRAFMEQAGSNRRSRLPPHP